MRSIAATLRARRLNGSVQHAKGAESTTGVDALTYGSEVKRVGPVSLIWDFLSIFR
jgi:hypothetical protein